MFGKHPVVETLVFCYAYSMIRFAHLTAVFMMLFLTGCAPAFDVGFDAPAPPELEGEWSVKMTQSGGIMGLMRTVEVSSDGSITISDDRLERATTGKLSGDDLRMLRELVENTRVSARGDNVSVCADCFVYEIEIRSNGKTFTAQVDDMTMPDSGMEPLVTFLRSLMDANIR
jgi:hypothetical protein